MTIEVHKNRLSREPRLTEPVDEASLDKEERKSNVSFGGGSQATAVVKRKHIKKSQDEQGEVKN